MPEPQTLEGRRENLSKEDLSEIVSRLTGLEEQIGECSKRINVRIDERMSEHSAIRNMQAEIKAVTLGFEELKGIVKGAIGNGDRRLKDHDQEIEQLALRITGLENAVSEIKSRISQIEHIARSNTEAINNWGSQIMRSQSSLHDTVNLALKQSSSKPPSQTLKDAAKTKVAWFFAGVPTCIYATITLVHYLKTGEIILIGALQ